MTETRPAPPPELCRLSAAALLDGYRRRRLSPVEVIGAVLKQVDAADPSINAFCLVDPERALTLARESEQRWHRNQPLGLLDGVPVSIKDLVLTRGWPTLRGSRTVPRDQPWAEDAPAVAKLLAHGAVLFGKTTTPEFGWKGLADSPLTGVTRNPWDLSRTPGGSSGGAAAALAAGLGPLALGSDGGGSIRIPAAFTGVFGIKATHGRVPTFPPSSLGTMGHVGPMGRTVADTALMLQAISGYDPRDPYAAHRPDEDFASAASAGVAGLRAGLARAVAGVGVDPEIDCAVMAAAQALEAADMAVEETVLPLDGAREAFVTLWDVGNAQGLRALDDAARATLEPGLQACVARGRAATALGFAAAQSAREQLSIRMNALHERFDVILTPTLPLAAFAAGHDVPPGSPFAQWWEWAPFTYPFNMTTQPAASAPCGFTASGLPIGLHIVGRRWDEATVLRVAGAVERAMPFRMPWNRG